MISSKPLAALHGYLCSDGCVIKSNNPSYTCYRIDLRNTEMTLLKNFQQCFQEEFNETPAIGHDRCKKDSKEIYWKLTNRFGSFYCKEWRFPKMTKPCAALWLRACFDCEAWVNNRPAKDRSVGFESANGIGLDQIHLILEHGFNIQSKIKKRKGHSTFRLHIFGKENLERFQQEIGFLHPKKKKKLEEALDSYSYWKWKIDSDEEFLQILKEKVKMKKHARRIFSRKENLELLQEKLIEKGIESAINERINGLGTTYYELNIYGKVNIAQVDALVNITSLGEKTCA